MWGKTMRQLSERFFSCRTQQEYTQVGMKIFRFSRTEGPNRFLNTVADNAVRLALSTLKAEIAGALKTQLSNVALHKHSVVRTIYFKFHAVAAFHLKSHIV